MMGPGADTEVCNSLDVPTVNSVAHLLGTPLPYGCWPRPTSLWLQVPKGPVESEVWLEPQAGGGYPGGPNREQVRGEEPAHYHCYPSLAWGQVKPQAAQALL